MSDESATAPGNIPTPKILPPQFKKSSPYFWICDCSESMGLKNKANNLVKMDMVNKAIPLVIEKIREISEIARKRQTTMRTIMFSDHAEWVDNESIPVDQSVWTNLSADGATALGEAFSKLAQALKLIGEGGTMPERRTYPPVLILITDGYPTDDWETGLTELYKVFWGQNAVRLALALEGADREVLEAFIGDTFDKENKLVEIQDLTKLAYVIKDNSTVYGYSQD